MGWRVEVSAAARPEKTLGGRPRENGTARAGENRTRNEIAENAEWNSKTGRQRSNVPRPYDIVSFVFSRFVLVGDGGD